MKRTTFTLPFAGIIALVSLLNGGLALAADTTTAPILAVREDGQRLGMMQRAPGIFGVVTAINGNSLTVERREGVWWKGGTSTSTNTNTSYSVDGSKATVTKNRVTSNLTSIAVGDTVFVQGTVIGQNIEATRIDDGTGGRMGMMGRGQRGEGTPGFEGNGQPVVGGTVAMVDGSTFTLTNRSNVTFTIDATSATIHKRGATSTMSDIKVGDGVIVQGTVNGTAITADTVIDHGETKTINGERLGVQTGFAHRMMGVFGGFFHRMFGFF